MPIDLQSYKTSGEALDPKKLLVDLRRIVDLTNKLEREQGVTTQELRTVVEVVQSSGGPAGGGGAIPAPIGPFPAVNVDIALEGNGTAGSPVNVRVDGVTVIVNGSNQLESVSTPPAADTLTGTLTPTRIPYASAPHILSDSANLNWDNVNSRLGVGTAAPSASIHTTGGIRVEALTAGRVPYVSTGGLLADNALFVWDNTNLALGIGTATPLSNFQISGNALYGVGLPVSYQTTINIIGGISAADTTITVLSTTNFPFAGTLRCELELITYTGKTPTTFTGCTRGRYLTTAVVHANTRIIALMPFVLADTDVSGSAILLGPSQLYVGVGGSLNEIGSATALATFKLGQVLTFGGTIGLAIQDSGATGMVFMQFDGTNAVFGTRTNTSISFRTNNTMRATITVGQNFCLDSAVNDPASGTKCIIVGDGTAPGNLASNTALFFANDVSGTVNMFTKNEANEVTQLSGNMELPTSRILRFGGATATEVALRRTTVVLETRLADDSAFAQHSALEFMSNRANFLMRTAVAWNNGAAAGAGTLTNAPTAGDPTKWIPVDDNGTTRYLPSWT